MDRGAISLRVVCDILEDCGMQLSFGPKPSNGRPLVSAAYMYQEIVESVLEQRKDEHRDADLLRIARVFAIAMNLSADKAERAMKKALATL